MILNQKISNKYLIEDEVLIKYIQHCNKNNIKPNFDSFLNWWDTIYYIDDFIWDFSESKFEKVNDSNKVNEEFQKEIDKVKFKIIN